MTGEPLFTAQAIVILPTGLTTDELRTELERIGNVRESTAQRPQ